MDSGCSIYLFLFCMDNTKVYVIYELGMFVWFVLSILLFKGLHLFGPDFFFGSKIPLYPMFK